MLTLEQLREWCRDYDRLQGRYPEHECEGWTVLKYIEARIAGGDLPEFWWSPEPDDWIEEPRY